MTSTSEQSETSRTHPPYPYEKYFMVTARKWLKTYEVEGVVDFNYSYSLRANLFRALDQLKVLTSNWEKIRELQYGYKFQQCFETNRVNLQNESQLLKNIDELANLKSENVILKPPLIEVDTIRMCRDELKIFDAQIDKTTQAITPSDVTKKDETNWKQPIGSLENKYMKDTYKMIADGAFCYTEGSQKHCLDISDKTRMRDNLISIRNQFNNLNKNIAQGLKELEYQNPFFLTCVNSMEEFVKSFKMKTVSGQFILDHCLGYKDRFKSIYTKGWTP